MFLRLKNLVSVLKSISKAIVVCISTALPAMAVTPTVTIQNMRDSVNIVDISSNIILVLISIVVICLSFVVWKYLVTIIAHESHPPSDEGGYDTGHLQDEVYMNWLKTKEGASSSLRRRYWDESYQDYLNKDTE